MKRYMRRFASSSVSACRQAVDWRIFLQANAAAKMKRTSKFAFKCVNETLMWFEAKMHSLICSRTSK